MKVERKPDFDIAINILEEKLFTKTGVMKTEKILQKLRNLQAKGVFQEDEINIIFLGKTNSPDSLKTWEYFQTIFQISGSSSHYLARSQGVENLKNMLFILNHEDSVEKTTFAEDSIDNIRFIDTKFTLINELNRFLQKKICERSGKGNFIAQNTNNCYICNDCLPDKRVVNFNSIHEVFKTFKVIIQIT